MAFLIGEDCLIQNSEKRKWDQEEIVFLQYISLIVWLYFFKQFRSMHLEICCLHN